MMTGRGNAAITRLNEGDRMERSHFKVLGAFINRPSHRNKSSFNFTPMEMRRPASRPTAGLDDSVVFHLRHGLPYPPDVSTDTTEQSIKKRQSPPRSLDRDCFSAE